jgi:hypothetical protein
MGWHRASCMWTMNDRRREPKWHVACRLVCYFSFFIHLAKFLFILGTTTYNEWQQSCWRVRRHGERGSNNTDVSHGCQVCCSPFFLYLTKLFFILGTMTNYKWARMTIEIGMTNDGEWGPNDAWCVIWAPGMLFFFLLIYLTKFLFILGTTIDEKWVQWMTAEMGTTNDGEPWQGPNDARTVARRRPRFLFFVYI